MSPSSFAKACKKSIDEMRNNPGKFNEIITRCCAALTVITLQTKLSKRFEIFRHPVNTGNK